jgi:hypothetical protein
MSNTQTEVKPHQWTDGGDRVLILRRCNADMTSSTSRRGIDDAEPFKWSESGVVECQDWTPDNKCGGGLHGWPWGWCIGEGANYDIIGDKWIVFAAIPDDVIGEIVDENGGAGGKCKARRGEVVFCGAFAAAWAMINGGRHRLIEAMAKTLPNGSSGNYSTAASSGDSSTAASSGNSSKAASSGNSSKAASSGDSSTAASSGDSSTAASSGDYSKAVSSGNSSKAASSGNSSTAASSGDSSTAASSGDSSKAASSGDYSTAASSGNSSTAASSGNSSTAASSGNYSTAASSGNYSKAASSGDYSKAASSGD